MEYQYHQQNISSNTGDNRMTYDNRHEEFTEPNGNSEHLTNYNSIDMSRRSISESFNTATGANTYMPSTPQTPHTNRSSNCRYAPEVWPFSPILQNPDGQALYLQEVPVTETLATATSRDILDERLNSPKVNLHHASGFIYPYTPESQTQNIPPAIIQVYQGDFGVPTPPRSNFKTPMISQGNLVQNTWINSVPFPDSNKRLSALSSLDQRPINPDDPWKHISSTPQLTPSNSNDYASSSQPTSSTSLQWPVSCQDLESTPAHDETASCFLGSPLANQPSSTQKPPHQDTTRKGRKRNPVQNLSSILSHPIFKIQKPLQYAE